jgi:hypothetical protein
VLAGAADAVLGAGALESGAAAEAGPAAEVEAAGVEGAACELELLLHPANATESDTAMATEGKILEYDNRDISK